MKSPPLTINKIFILSGIILLIIFILKDLHSIYLFREEKDKLDYYLNLERKNIIEYQQSISNFTDILIHFQDAESQERYLPFLRSSSKSFEELEKISRWHLDYGDNFFNNYYTSEIEDMITKISSIQNSGIIDFYQLLAKTLMLYYINHEIYGSSSDEITVTSIVKPFSQDSAYIGRRVKTDKLSRLTFEINGQKEISSKIKYDIFSIPKSDTINIITTYLEAVDNHVDTFTHHQTIANIKGEWKYIGSD